MQLTIEHLTGSKKGQLEQVEIAEGDRCTFGRNPNSKVAFDPQQDLDVSTDHAQLMPGDDGKLHLTDLGSRNGTLLNGSPVNGGTPIAVEPGSKVQFGKNNGPQVRVLYTPGPRKDQIALGQMQQQMAQEREQAAAAKKKTMMVAGGVGVLGIIAIVIWSILGGRAERRRQSEETQVAAHEAAEKAKKRKANLHAPGDYQKAEQMNALGKTSYDKGDYEGAKKHWTDARKQYEDAIDNTMQALIAKQADEAKRAVAEADERRRAEQDEREAAMRAEQERLLAKMREDEAKNRKAMEDLKNRLAAASEAERRKIQEEIDRYKQKPDSERAREIIAANEPGICFIYVESYVQAKGAKDRTVIAKSEGSGYVIAKDQIATAKHVVQPWKYDPKVLATAKKIKEEHGLEVQDYIEVYMMKSAGQPFEKKFDSASGACKLLKITGDKRVATAITVQIEWNAAMTDVPGITVHEKNVDDLAIIGVPGGGLKTVTLASGAAKKFDAMLVLGTVRDTTGVRAIKPSPARAEVQQAEADAFSLNATVPSSFSGAPVFKYDGNVWGIITGTEGANLICLPVEKVRQLMAGGGG